MRKISAEYENPVDNIFLDITEKTADWFYNNGFNPNGVTTLSVLSRLLTLYLIGIKSYKIASIAWLVGYYFDCVDGYMARKYNLQTKIGDYYDHVSDAVFTTIVFLILYFKYINLDGNVKWLLLGMVLIGILHFVTFGCYEIMLAKNKTSETSDSCEWTRYLCPTSETRSVEDVIKYMRWVGVGTFQLYLAVLIFVLNYYDN